jgi:hypothetical protein
MDNLMPIERIERRIFLMRGQKVMLDKDLAELYGVETKVLNQAVTRNYDRFPEDFMFQLNKQEFDNLIFQFGISNLKSQFVTSSWGGVRKLPFAFTEQGIAMLSSVLRSKRAIRVNISIMRAFVHLRQIISGHKELAFKVKELEKQYSKHEVEITTVFKVLKKLMEPPKEVERPKKRIGFITGKVQNRRHQPNPSPFGRGRIEI